jgi:hypothetical protein
MTRPNVPLFPDLPVTLSLKTTFFILPGQSLSIPLKVIIGCCWREALQYQRSGVPTFLLWEYDPNDAEQGAVHRARRVRLRLRR